MFNGLLAISIVTLCMTICAKEQTPQRVVVLSPSTLTSIKELGAIDKVVCAADPLGDDINKKKIKSVGYYHRPNIERIVECRPDLIIATYAGTPPDTYNKLKKMGFNVISENPKNIYAIRDSIKELASIFNVSPQKVINRFDHICSGPQKNKKKFIVLVGLDPMFYAGSKTFVSSAVECAGGINAFSGEYTRTNIESIMSRSPDLIIISVDDPALFKDYKDIKQRFKNVVVVSPELLLKPSIRILDGVNKLKPLFK